jgi:hypothetical protein
MCLMLAAAGTALAVGPASPALASLPTLTVAGSQLAPPSSSTSDAAWESGRLTVTARRVPDGRLRVRLNVRIVLARAITGQLAIQPCNAAYNAADLLANAADPVAHPIAPFPFVADLSDPAVHPVVPFPFYSGYSPYKDIKLHRGLNDHLRLTAVVSSDDRWTAVPHHWTDCVSVNLIDQAETDKAAINQNSYVVDRVGDIAFTIKPLILSITQPDNLGQHR